MEISSTLELVRRLREHLEPVERAEALIDLVEGVRPLARRAAVLLALFPQEGETYLTFIRRATTLRSHSGEIAFPGGRAEPDDTSCVTTALREAQEEIGLDPTRVEVLGVLHPVFTVVSNYLITPVVAFLPHGLGDVQLQSSEVAELLLIRLACLADPSLLRTEIWSRPLQSPQNEWKQEKQSSGFLPPSQQKTMKNSQRSRDSILGEKRTVYFYDYGSYCIWGATARILKALLSVSALV